MSGLVKELRVESDRTLLVQGPASLILKEGAASILGADLQPARMIVIRDQKQIAIETEADSTFQLNLSYHGDLREIRGSTVPQSWKKAAETLENLEGGSALILGGNDAGKSTLCAFLVNSLIKSVGSASIIDADIGQTDVGPPTTIGYGVVHDRIYSLSSVPPAYSIFIGHTSAADNPDKVVYSVHRLVSLSSSSSPVNIVNTDGWIADRSAVEYKLKLIETVHPDIVIAISTDNELAPIINGTGYPILEVESSSVVKKRTRNERRQLREAKYRHYLSNGKIRTYPLKKLKNTESLRLLSRDAKSKQIRRISVLSALLDERETMLNLGILVAIDHLKGTMKVHSQEVEDVSYIEPGYLKVSTEGEEVGYLK